MSVLTLHDIDIFIEMCLSLPSNSSEILLLRFIKVQFVSIGPFCDNKVALFCDNEVELSCDDELS